MDDNVNPYDVEKDGLQFTNNTGELKTSLRMKDDAKDSEG